MSSEPINSVPSFFQQAVTEKEIRDAAGEQMREHIAANLVKNLEEILSVPGELGGRINKFLSVFLSYESATLARMFSVINKEQNQELKSFNKGQHIERRSFYETILAAIYISERISQPPKVQVNKNNFCNYVHEFLKTQDCASLFAPENKDKLSLFCVNIAQAVKKNAGNGKYGDDQHRMVLKEFQANNPSSNIAQLGAETKTAVPSTLPENEAQLNKIQLIAALQAKKNEIIQRETTISQEEKAKEEKAGSLPFQPLIIGRFRFREYADEIISQATEEELRALLSTLQNEEGENLFREAVFVAANLYEKLTPAQQDKITRSQLLKKLQRLMSGNLEIKRGEFFNVENRQKLKYQLEVFLKEILKKIDELNKNKGDNLRVEEGEIKEDKEDESDEQFISTYITPKVKELLTNQQAIQQESLDEYVQKYVQYSGGIKKLLKGRIKDDRVQYTDRDFSQLAHQIAEVRKLQENLASYAKNLCRGNEKAVIEHLQSLPKEIEYKLFYIRPIENSNKAAYFIFSRAYIAKKVGEQLQLNHKELRPEDVYTYADRILVSFSQFGEDATFSDVFCKEVGSFLNLSSKKQLTDLLKQDSKNEFILFCQNVSMAIRLKRLLDKKNIQISLKDLLEIVEKDLKAYSENDAAQIAAFQDKKQLRSFCDHTYLAILYVTSADGKCTYNSYLDADPPSYKHKNAIQLWWDGIKRKERDSEIVTNVFLLLFLIALMGVLIYFSLTSLIVSAPVGILAILNHFAPVILLLGLPVIFSIVSWYKLIWINPESPKGRSAAFLLSVLSAAMVIVFIFLFTPALPLLIGQIFGFIGPIGVILCVGLNISVKPSNQNKGWQIFFGTLVAFGAAAFILVEALLSKVVNIPSVISTISTPVGCLIGVAFVIAYLLYKCVEPWVNKWFASRQELSELKSQDFNGKINANVITSVKKLSHTKHNVLQAIQKKDNDYIFVLRKEWHLFLEAIKGCCYDKGLNFRIIACKNIKEIQEEIKNAVTKVQQKQIGTSNSDLVKELVGGLEKINEEIQSFIQKVAENQGKNLDPDTVLEMLEELIILNNGVLTLLEQTSPTHDRVIGVLNIPGNEGTSALGLEAKEREKRTSLSGYPGVVFPPPASEVMKQSQSEVSDQQDDWPSTSSFSSLKGSSVSEV